MKKIILAIILIAVFCQLQAEVDGSKGYQMLRIMIDPVTAAQGGNGVSNSQSSFTFLENAAAPLLQNGKVLSVSQNVWLFGTSLSSIGYRNSKGKKTFGYGIRYLDYGKIDGRDNIGEKVGEYHPLDMAITFNFGYRILASHYLGINMNGLYEKIDDASSLGLTGDLGYVYLTPIKELKLLVSIKNMGVSSNMENENVEMPLTMELGLSKDFDIASNVLSAGAKLVKDVDNDKLKGSLGLSTRLHSIFFLRAGYKFNYDIEGLGCGFGIKYKGFMIDYAYNTISEDLKDVHLFGLSYHF